MIWSRGYKPVLEDFKNLLPYDWETPEGLVLSCWLEFSPVEKMADDSPGYPASMELVWCLVEGVDIMPVLSEYLIQQIEAGALNGNE